MSTRTLFVTGGTGYIGRSLIPRLLKNGYTVRALVRPGSEGRLPEGCVPITGNALDAATFSTAVQPADTLVHLVGVPHPGPTKKSQFKSIDLVSVQQSVAATSSVAGLHFLYLSVAQPAPVMKEYVAVRAEGERLIREAGFNATFIRPWYVLGPGHRWPCALIPVYNVFERIPATRESATRLGLVTLDQMVDALVWAVLNPPKGVRIVDVPGIRRLSDAGTFDSKH